MNEIDILTLEIMKHTAICDVETAQETAEIIINTLGYHKKEEKISPEAIVLALDIQKSIIDCDYECDTCRYHEFKDVDVSPYCLNVKLAEALIKLGWRKAL